jgi:hypothetical protein
MRTKGGGGGWGVLISKMTNVVYSITVVSDRGDRCSLFALKGTVS